MLRDRENESYSPKSFTCNVRATLHNFVYALIAHFAKRDVSLARLQSFCRQWTRLAVFFLFFSPSKVYHSRRFPRRQYRLSSFMRFCKAEAKCLLLGRQMRWGSNASGYSFLRFDTAPGNSDWFIPASVVLQTFTFDIFVNFYSLDLIHLMIKELCRTKWEN